jgi:TolB-like protein
MPIIITRQGQKGGRVLDKSQFGEERNLQQYIHDNPEAIPIYDIQKSKKLFVAAREFRTESGGRIDALAVDQDGDVYIVETKLSANADKRQVVAQVLDYGASLWKEFKNFANPDPFFARLDLSIQSSWKISFREKVQDFFQLSDEQADNMVESMRQNLEDGALKFVVLMDSMDERLKDLIAFVNEKSDFSIYGVELEYYKHEDSEIVIPKLYGAEVKRDKARTGSTRRTSLAEGVMEILQDGEWHTGPDLRHRLGTDAITSVLKNLRELGKIELEPSGRGHKARIPGEKKPS